MPTTGAAVAICGERGICKPTVVPQAKMGEACVSPSSAGAETCVIADGETPGAEFIPMLDIMDGPRPTKWCGGWRKKNTE